MRARSYYHKPNNQITVAEVCVARLEDSHIRGSV